MNQNHAKIIACETVIKELMPVIPPNVEYRSIDPGLHVSPERLRAHLQEVIDDTGAEANPIILGFGLCSMAVVGLKASKSPLIIPRQDDCIGIFLGSRERYKEELKKEPGTYFISRGWIDAGITLIDELEQMEARYDKKIAEKVMKRMLKHYVRLAFIDMGHQDQENYVEYSREAAKKFELKLDQIRGTTQLLKQMCSGPWDGEFVVAPPGHKVSLEDFGMV